MILQNHHVLAVPDARATARFFVEVLGFRVVAEPPGWVFVARDRCMVMLGSCPEALAPSALGDHAYVAYLLVDDADALHAEWATRGGAAIGALEDKPWGLREFAVRTPDGHGLTVGQALPASARRAVDADAFARSWLGAFNAKDLDAIMAHYAENVEHSSPTVVRVIGEPTGIVRGKPALRAYFEQALAAAPPDLRYELTRTHVGVDGVTLVYHRTGGTAGREAEDADGGGARRRAPEAPSSKLVAETFHFDRSGLVARAFVAHADA